MMLVSIDKLEVAAFETLLIGIPESVGLLIFGVGLVAAAVLIRRLLAKSEVERKEG